MNRRLLTTLLAVALLALAASAVGLSSASFDDRSFNPDNTFTAAQSFCDSPGTVTVTGTADTQDTWTNEASAATATGGTAATLEVSSRNSARNRRGLVKFTLPNLNGCSVTSASLRLNISGASGGAARTLEAYRVTANWDESTATWNSTANTPQGSAVTTTSATGYRTWAVTSFVQNMYSSGNHNGFLIKDSAESAGNSALTQVIVSSEGAAGSRPELVITKG